MNAAPQEFSALVIDRADGRQSIALKTHSLTDLAAGDVVVRVACSSLNYKDALAVTGTAPIARKFPLVPGIDFAGTVIESVSDRFQAGDEVILTGWGVGEKHDGGFAQIARVPGDWLIPRPKSLSAETAMAIGTAGLTSMLCVVALQEQGVTPDAGDILVTGATGGVGSLSIMLLAKAGYSVTACTGKATAIPMLNRLGAAKVIDRAEFSGELKPLAKTRWAGAIDVVGSTTLAHVISQMNYGGVVAACGLAQGMDLPTSVAPFILRGVNLLGIDSVMCPTDRRQHAWQRLADDIDAQKLESITTRIRLQDVVAESQKMLAGQTTGRAIVRVACHRRGSSRLSIVFVQAGNGPEHPARPSPSAARNELQRKPTL